jgi:hypothetical protein
VPHQNRAATDRDCDRAICPPQPQHRSRVRSPLRRRGDGASRTASAGQAFALSSARLNRHEIRHWRPKFSGLISTGGLFEIPRREYHSLSDKFPDGNARPQGSKTALVHRRRALQIDWPGNVTAAAIPAATVAKRMSRFLKLPAWDCGHETGTDHRELI